VAFNKKWLLSKDNINPLRINNNYDIPYIHIEDVDVNNDLNSIDINNNDGKDDDNANDNENIDTNNDNNDNGNNNDDGNDNNDDNNDNHKNSDTGISTNSNSPDHDKDKNTENYNGFKFENTDLKYPKIMTTGRAPLILVSDWQGHHSAILSIKYLSFSRDINDIECDIKAPLNGYLISASVDSEVLLWTIQGTYIGMYGFCEWRKDTNIHTRDLFNDREEKEERTMGTSTHKNAPGDKKPAGNGPTAPIGSMNSAGKFTGYYSY
jgi:hypothetical protein